MVARPALNTFIAVLVGLYVAATPAQGKQQLTDSSPIEQRKSLGSDSRPSDDTVRQLFKVEPTVIDDRNFVFGGFLQGHAAPTSHARSEARTRANESVVDPDTSKKVLTDWTAWLDRLSAAVLKRTSARKAIYQGSSLETAVCQISFKITNDRLIHNIKIVRPSGNECFDSILSMSICEEEKTSDIQFPNSSRRTCIEVVGDFSDLLGFVKSSVKPVPYIYQNKPKLPPFNSSYRGDFDGGLW